jgi:hypothetical protein
LLDHQLEHVPAARRLLKPCATARATGRASAASRSRRDRHQRGRTRHSIASSDKRGRQLGDRRLADRDRQVQQRQTAHLARRHTNRARQSLVRLPHRRNDAWAYAKTASAPRHVNVGAAQRLQKESNRLRFHQPEYGRVHAPS